MFFEEVIAKVSSFFFCLFLSVHNWKTFKGYLELRRHRLFWAPQQLCSCYQKKKKKKVWVYKDKGGERHPGQFGRMHRLVFIVWMWFNQGRHTPPTVPPSQQQTSHRMQSRAGWHFICVSLCVQWHGCRGFEIIWPGEKHINCRCQTGRTKWKST